MEQKKDNEIPITDRYEEEKTGNMIFYKYKPTDKEKEEELLAKKKAETLTDYSCITAQGGPCVYKIKQGTVAPEGLTPTEHFAWLKACNFDSQQTPLDAWRNFTPICVEEDYLYGTKHSIICAFGGWHVTVKGDLIYTGDEYEWRWYPIWAEQLLDPDEDNTDWILHLSKKYWFTYDCFINFKRAIWLACEIAGAPNHLFTQIKSYSHRVESKHISKPSAKTSGGSKTPILNKVKKTYLMQNEQGYTKIGYSANPRQRESTLQAEEPTIKLLKVCDKNVEKRLHTRYADKRVRGEWFDLTNSDIAEICEEFNFREPNKTDY